MADSMLLDLEEAMADTRLGRSTLLQLSYDGLIPSLKVGRRRLWPREQLRKWVEERMRLEEAQHEG